MLTPTRPEPAPTREPEPEPGRRPAPRRYHAWLAALALPTVLAPSPAHAIAWGMAPVTLTLGTGRGAPTAERYPRPCDYRGVYAQSCFAWRFTNLAAPPSDRIATANMFAVARRGRIVAVMSGGVMYTDDRGASWSSARFEGSATPLSVAFDPAGGEFGAAVGTAGTLWTTEDSGATWRVRRDSPGPSHVDVAVVGRTVAWSDERGGVWVSTDGGTSLRTLADSARGGPMPTMTVRDRAIWVLLGERVWWRADGNGSVERIER